MGRVGVGDLGPGPLRHHAQECELDIPQSVALKLFCLRPVVRHTFLRDDLSPGWSYHLHALGKRTNGDTR